MGKPPLKWLFVSKRKKTNTQQYFLSTKNNKNTFINLEGKKKNRIEKHLKKLKRW
jgi:hypothetical protein